MPVAEYVPLKDLRKAYRGYQKVYEALAYAYDKGWGAKEQGHGYRLYCSCSGRDAGQFAVPHTPRNQDWAAARIRRVADLCPGRHDLI